jgi:hypothetical protein
LATRYENFLSKKVCPLKKLMQRSEKQTSKDPLAPRALGMVVRQLREKQKMSRAQSNRAKGLSVGFSGKVEGGQAPITDVVRIAFGLNYPITDFVSQVEGPTKLSVVATWPTRLWVQRSVSEPG